MAIIRSVSQTAQVGEEGRNRPAGPVVLAVSPRLLSDTVSRALSADGIPTVGVERASGVACEVAVVSPGREIEVSARTVLTLGGDGGGDTAGAVVDLAGLRSALSALQRDRR
jgi:hypothetical protein